MMAVLFLGALAGEMPICGPAARVTFREGAPVDVFTVENISANASTDWAIAAVEIDLVPSAGRLVFDTVRGGAGRNVSQPFVARPVEGEAALADLPVVPDGAEGLTLSFTRFQPGQRFRFTIDMDDRLGGGVGTMIDGPEIEGAMVTVRFAGGTSQRTTESAPFDAAAIARPATACLS
ncbi:MAG: hypothetical protein AAF899_01820 [Pseudomonadota bacterium]